VRFLDGKDVRKREVRVPRSEKSIARRRAAFRLCLRERPCECHRSESRPYIIKFAEVREGRNAPPYPKVRLTDIFSHGCGHAFASLRIGFNIQRAKCSRLSSRLQSRMTSGRNQVGRCSSTSKFCGLSGAKSIIRTMPQSRRRETAVFEDSFWPCRNLRSFQALYCFSRFDPNSKAELDLVN